MLPLKHLWYSVISKPLLDRVFYVPFWDCPYNCEFCCVDSLPGRPAHHPDAGEATAFALAKELHELTGNKIEFHLYGGEPMMRPKYVMHLAKIIKDKPEISKLVLYTTLRSAAPDEIVKLLGNDRIQILVNSEILNDKAIAAMKRLKKVAGINNMPMYLPVGRGVAEVKTHDIENYPGKKFDFLQKITPFGWLARSCWSNISGPLINGPQNTVHLCCLPQSPVIGTFTDEPAKTMAVYTNALGKAPKAIERKCKTSNAIHPCAVCNACTGYSSTANHTAINNYTIEAVLN